MSQINAIKGTADILPAESYKIQYIEAAAKRAASRRGYYEMRTPVFEYTELFNRGVGDTTDVVQKEMYTFDDKGGRSITLRPEGTAGAARAFLEHGLFNEPLPQRIMYLTTCYRYEKPQAGRYREFRQFGIECFGSPSYLADAEVIGVAADFYKSLGVPDLTLEINSIGCPQCRGNYTAALRAYFEKHAGELCETCLSRLSKNPMRILDCKSPVCSAIAANAPVVIDYICDECKEHFEGLKGTLEGLGIDYTINPRIVRGLDYYTRTVFEFVSHNEKTQGLVCGGGGRYDGLIEELGGSPVPACGFGLGIERTLLAMECGGASFGDAPVTELFIVTAGERALKKASLIAAELRGAGVCASYDIMGRSVKAQMKYANKIGAVYTAVLGDNELDSGTAVLKNMRDGSEREISTQSFAGDFTKG